MNATTAPPTPLPASPLDAGPRVSLTDSPLAHAYTVQPPSLLARVAGWLYWPVVAVVALAALYLVYTLYAGGQTWWALGTLALFGAGFGIYLNQNGFAWRYLFPGVTGMLVFIAFPLLYTTQIGFTNYSSAHLLSQERVRDYLLDQHEAVPDRVRDYALHAQGREFRLVLRHPDTGALEWVTPPLALRGDKPVDVTLLPAAQAADGDMGPALSLRDLVQHREALARLRLHLPGESSEADTLHYLGLREFGPIRRHFEEQTDGSLVRTVDGQRFAPNGRTGYYENQAGEHLQPGYKVMVGWQNYARMVLDADFRGPFLSIFTWTVVFSLLTVVFATAIGMMLAVLLNWEDLRFRGTYRTLLFLPYAVPGFISILVFKGLFNQNFGEINAILDALFGVKPAWFADPLLAKTMLLIVNVWLGYPYIMILAAGLLKAIPADLYEASAIAGAGPLTNFFKITAPLIIKPLSPLLVAAFAFNFNNFVVIALLTDGRPDYLSSKIPAGQTDILVSYTYRIAFRDSGSDFGLAAAISTLIFFLVAAMSLLNLRLMRKQS